MPPFKQNPRRILILGCGGAGKSSLARKLGELLHLPVIYLDKLFWKPGWKEPDRKDFDRKVERLAQRSAWIMDGNYSHILKPRLKRADLVIYLDLPRWRCVLRILDRWFRFYHKTRPDMAPGCPEKMDWEFMKWEWNFNRDVRPRIFSELAAFPRLRVMILNSLTYKEELVRKIVSK